MAEPLLQVKNLKKYFKVPAGMNHAVDDITFTLEAGRTIGVVGESGCGKSTLGRTIIHLQQATDGQVILNGKDVTNVRGRELRRLHEQMQIVFQNPYSSLNPRQRIETTVIEPMINSGKYRTRKEAKEEANRLMDLVGVDYRLRQAYPHELDGGRRQRVGIARALALDPRFIVCDEPVSALDVSIQAQILNLLKELQKEYGIAYLFITHDLSVVNHFSDEIAVMYLGQIVEKAPAKELFRNPTHPYTKALLSAIPIPDVDARRDQIPLMGEISSPINMKQDCHFAVRCPFATDQCRSCTPPLEDRGNGHFVACHLY